MELAAAQSGRDANALPDDAAIPSTEDVEIEAADAGDDRPSPGTRTCAPFCGLQLERGDG